MDRRNAIHRLGQAGAAALIGIGVTCAELNKPAEAAKAEAFTHLEKVTEALRDLVRVQSAEGNWNYDPYMMGLANGLILALAMVEGGEPKYFDAPAVWVRDDERSNTPAGALERLSRAFRSDPDYARGWQANIACAAMDEGLEPAAANRAAARFLKAAFNVELE